MKFETGETCVDIQVDFYKKSGKWYSGGTVSIPSRLNIFDDEFKTSILQNQEILVQGWEKNEDFYVVTNDTPENYADPNYHCLYGHLFLPGAFSKLTSDYF